DMSRFATVQHFCSWLGLCPLVKKTGGRVKSSRTRPGVNRAAVAFRLAANGLHASKGAIGAFLRRKQAHLGAPKAITAAGRKVRTARNSNARQGPKSVTRIRHRPTEVFLENHGSKRRNGPRRGLMGTGPVAEGEQGPQAG